MSLRTDELLAAQAIEAGAYKEAVRLLRPLAERNSEYALLTLGWIYETGAIGTPDKDVARSFYEHAISQGDANACHYLGGLLWKDGQEIDALKVFERGAQLGNEKCNSELQRLSDFVAEKAAERAMEEGDYEEAIRLLGPLAERNSRFALGCLAYIYETGVTGAPDMKLARSFYERLASHGWPEDQYQLGRFLRAAGEEALARAAYQRGAAQGHVPSMAKLGRMMIKGRGGPRDVHGGSDWIEEAVKEHTFEQRECLAVEEQNARSLFAKALVKVKIARLWLKGTRAVIKGLPNKTR